MSFPDIPAGKGIPLVDLTTYLFNEPTMDAMDARYSSAGGAVPVGGSTGQVLTKDSGTDYDTSWQDAATPSDASTTVKGIVELATVAEVLAGTDSTRAVTSDGVAAALATIGGGGTPSLGYVRVAGTVRNYMAHYCNFESGSYATKNVLGLARICLASPIPIASVILSVNTAGASGSYRFGIFEANSDGLPGAKVFETTLAGTSSGGSYTVTVGVTLPAGVYWVGVADQTSGGAMSKQTCITEEQGFSPTGSNAANQTRAVQYREPFLTVAQAGAFPSDLTGSTYIAASEVPTWTLRSTT